MKEKLKKSDAEIDRLKLENEQLYQRMQKSTKAEIENDRLRLENEQLHQRIQKMTLLVPNHRGLQDSGRYDPQSPWDWLQSFESDFAPHSVQEAELTNRLEQTETKLQLTQKELKKTKVELKQMEEKVHIIERR